MKKELPERILEDLKGFLESVLWPYSILNFKNMITVLVISEMAFGCGTSDIIIVKCIDSRQLISPNII